MQGTFAKLAFTPSVLSHQKRMGSAEAYAQIRTAAALDPPVLSEFERAFIEARDGFYQATVSETGWPYVQFRGGPAGFLRVLGPQTLGYTDFSGNRQYISRGNLDDNNRVALILLDYVQQRRLKLLGRVEIVEGEHAAATLFPKGAAAAAERAILIHVEAFDWNCPRHITPRYTRAEQQPELAVLQKQIAALRAENSDLKSRLDTQHSSLPSNAPIERTPL